MQGWTRFSNFGDLDALSEEEWDRVSTCLLLAGLGVLLMCVCSAGLRM